MPIRKVVTPKVPEPGIFSNCLMVGDQIFLAGFTARSQDNRPIGGDNMYAQSMAAFGKVKACLEAAGASVSDVLKVTTYVTDMSRRGEFGRARDDFFVTEPKPCSTLVEVKGLAFPGMLVEVDCVAIRGASK